MIIHLWYVAYRDRECTLSVMESVHSYIRHKARPNKGSPSILVQVMVWRRQASSHYLNQCWLRSILPYGVTTLYELYTVYWYQLQINCAISSHHNGLCGSLCFVTCQKQNKKQGNSNYLTHCSLVRPHGVKHLVRIGSCKGLSPGRRQAITWINTGFLTIGPIGITSLVPWKLL